MITCSYCGRENEDAAVHCRECGTVLPSTPVSEGNPENPQDLPLPRRVDAQALAAAFSFHNGFHRADWNLIRGWIDAHVAPLDAEEAWNEAALAWVARLRDDLGGNYFILQSRQTVLLCDQSPDTTHWLLEYADRAAIAIQERLGKTAWGGGFGKNVVLVFSEEDDYYQYVSYHSPNGEQASSGGVCIDSGYTHLAVPWHEELDAASTIVHELTHACLAHLPLPLWINEGVAVALQKAIAPPRRAVEQGEHDALLAESINWRPPLMWDELAERHFSFWNEDNIQSFWAGTSFYTPGDSSELSYSLAEVLVKLLSESERGDGNAFRAFLEAARQDDAGQTAAMDVLGTDLGKTAGTFLGEGNWRPRRQAMVALWDAAGWERRAEEHEGQT